MRVRRPFCKIEKQKKKLTEKAAQFVGKAMQMIVRLGIDVSEARLNIQLAN